MTRAQRGDEFEVAKLRVTLALLTLRPGLELPSCRKPPRHSKLVVALRQYIPAPDQHHIRVKDLGPDAENGVEKNLP